MTEVGELPPSLRANPRLGDWLTIMPSGIVQVRSGKVEIGQGVLTALAQIVAEELDVNVARVQVVAATTGLARTRATRRAAFPCSTPVLHYVWSAPRPDRSTDAWPPNGGGCPNIR